MAEYSEANMRWWRGGVGQGGTIGHKQDFIRECESAMPHERFSIGFYPVTAV